MTYLKSLNLKAILSFILFSVIVAGTTSGAGYEIEEGYIISPFEVPSGIVFTDEYESTVYLYSNTTTQKLFSSPGSGRYLSFSADGNLIGFKYINPKTGLQQSAVYDIFRGEITYLTEPVLEAGQVSFSDDGKLAFTVGETLFIKFGDELTEYDLGYYNNRTYISPDGLFVIYKNVTEQLFLLNLVSGTSEQITNLDDGLGNIDWSFDSKYLAFETIDARIFVLDLASRLVTLVSEGEEPKWSPSELKFTFYKKDINFNTFTLLNSDIYVYDVNSEHLTNVTNTPERKEITPAYSGSEIIYSTYFDREIVKENVATESQKSLLALDIPLKPEFFEEYRGLSAAIEDVPDYVHIHQVYDTKQSWDQGRVCCGATSAMEVIASYEILDPAPIQTYNHTSDFGYYISDPYTYNSYTYTGFTGRWSHGGHGYLWNTSSVWGSSPYSNTKSYLEKHDIVASRSDYISWSMVQTEMLMEYPYILCSTGLTSGHIVVAVGLYGSTHTIYTNDPYGDKNVGNYGYIRNGKNAIYDWSDANTGHIKVTPVVWAVKAHYQYRMKVKSVFPEDNIVDASCSIESRIQFDVAIDPNTIDGKITLVDEMGNSVPVHVDVDLLSEGMLCFQPAEMLQPFTYYTITVKNGIQNIEGNPLKDDIVRNIKTGADFVPEGTIIDNFESATHWLDVNNNPATTGVVNANTSFSINTLKAYDGATSGKLSYESAGTEFEVRLEVAERVYLSTSRDSSFAVALYGDYSGNEATLYLENEAGELYPFLLDSLDYAGWKVKFVPLSKVPFEGPVYFNSFSVKSKPGGAATGNVYFDMILSGKTPTVILTHFPDDKQIEVPVSDNIVISFNKSMNTVSVESAFSITPEVNGSFSWNSENSEVTFDPDNNFTGKTNYIIAVDETATDVDGVPFYNNYQFGFTTQRVELLMMDNYPANGMNEISRSVEIQLAFDGPIDQSTLGGRIFLYDEQNNKLGVRVNTGVYTDGKIIFEPQNQLKRNAEYRIQLKQGISDEGGLLLQQDKEIVFRTETTEVVSGTIVDGFEDYDSWKQPDESSFSFGLNADETSVTVQSMKKVEGNKAIQLDYTFNTDSAYCVLYNEQKPNIGADGEFGLWIFGDRSGNSLEFLLKSGDDIFIDAGVINWTGWKFVSINLDDYSAGNDKAFFWVAVKHEADGANSGRLYLDGMQSDVVTGVEQNEELPVVYSLSQNYPNPFNPSTKITFSIPETGMVKLAVYNILGEKVATLLNREVKSGVHEVELNASNLSSGIYFYRLEAGSFTEVRKMIMLK